MIVDNLDSETEETNPFSREAILKKLKNLGLPTKPFKIYGLVIDVYESELMGVLLKECELKKDDRISDDENEFLIYEVDYIDVYESKDIFENLGLYSEDIIDDSGLMDILAQQSCETKNPIISFSEETSIVGLSFELNYDDMKESTDSGNVVFYEDGIAYEILPDGQVLPLEDY